MVPGNICSSVHSLRYTANPQEHCAGVLYMRVVDFREYRPAAVLVIDLVKHSTRPKDVVYEVQHWLEDVFNSVRTILALKEAFFNYTGDGYVCALTGESSPRVIDFLNAAIPRLREKLSKHNQSFRIGLDFGLVHLRENVLTSKPEFFDSPSIVAARLEHGANPGQILCSQRFYDVFKDYCGEIFSSDPVIVELKDRTITAFEVRPVPLLDISELLGAYLLGPTSTASEISDGRKEIFLIDDEERITELIQAMIKDYYPNAKVRTYPHGAAALKDLAPGRVGLACVDLMMAELDGIATMEKMLAIDPDILIFVVTAVWDDSVMEASLKNGAAYYLRKPFLLKDLTLLLDSWETIRQLRNSFRFMSETQGLFMCNLQRIRDLRISILQRVEKRTDRVGQMIRHRLKNTVTECLLAVSAGSDLLARLVRAAGEMKCLERLSRTPVPVGLSDLCINLETIMQDMRSIHNSLTLNLDCRGASSIGNLSPEIATILLVVNELIENAIEATKGKGAIDVQVGFLPSKGAIQIIVRDNGPGVPKRIRDKIFQAGISTKGEGRGLGLALVSDSVRSLGGEITYSFEDSSIFRVILPA